MPAPFYATTSPSYVDPNMQLFSLGLSLATERKYNEKKARLNRELDLIESQLDNTPMQISEDAYSIRLIDEFQVKETEYGVIACNKNNRFEFVEIEAKKIHLHTTTDANYKNLEAPEAYNSTLTPGKFEIVGTAQSLSEDEFFRYIQGL